MIGRIPFLVLMLLAVHPAGVSTAGEIAGQSGSGAAERRFQKGLEDFSSGRYPAAAAAFDEAADAPGANPRATASAVMAAKSWYRAGDFDRARSRASALLERHPGSAYTAEARYILALCEYRAGRYDAAATAIADLHRASHGSRSGPAGPAQGALGEILGSSARLFAIVADRHLPAAGQRHLAEAGLPEPLNSMAALALARSHGRRGEDSLALAVLDRLSARTDAPRDILQEAAALRTELTSGEPMQVAALVPLTGDRPGSDLVRIGNELLEGIRYAAELHNAAAGGGAMSVDVRAEDWGRDSAGAGELITRLAAGGGVRAVVGPVFSEAFAAAASAANALHLPIISPTATADGIAALGPFVFQANPDNATRGRAAAQYAVRALGMLSFAVMASDDPVGRSHAAGFAAEARALGATVFGTVLFPPDASDLRREFLELRRSVMAGGALIRRADLLRPDLAAALAAFGIDSAVSAGDSGVGPFVSVTELFGPAGYAVAESLGLTIAVPDTTAEDNDVPLTALDGIFLALGDPAQIDFVAPQFNYFNIRAQILGNNEWYDPARLRENRESAEGVVFVSDSFIDGGDSATTAFSDAFARRTGKPPTKFTLYGFDAMSLLLTRIAGGARTRNEIASALAGAPGYRGLHADISLRDGRVNRNLHVLKYSSGAVRRIGGVTVGEP